MYRSIPLQAKLLQYIDVLVDGKLKQELRDESLRFRGSKNQRLIDVQASLQADPYISRYGAFETGDSQVGLTDGLTETLKDVYKRQV